MSKIDNLPWKRIVVFGVAAFGLYLVFNFLQSFMGFRISGMPSYSTSRSAGVGMMQNLSYSKGSTGVTMMEDAAMGSPIVPPSPDEEYPVSESGDRMVVVNSSLSLLVKDVSQAVAQVLQITDQAGGFMVNRSLTRPQETEYANVTVRVPSDKVNDILEQFRNVGVRVVAENINGNDITDQYADLQTRLDTLNKTKAIFEDLLDKATSFDQILRAKQEVLRVQTEIDSLIGRQKYLVDSAKYAKVTLYISADELSLPYAPDDAWRPALTVKLAIRSLISNLRGIANWVIWAGVYAVIWVPLLIVVWVWMKRKGKKNNPVM